MTDAPIALFDTHCHLDREAFSMPMSEELQSAKKVGVTRFLIPGCGMFNWSEIESLSHRHSGVYFSLGIHPYYVEQHQEEDLERLAEKLLSRSERCVAVGECGLDYYHSKSNAAKQERFFVQQIKLANTYKLPLIVHSRNAHQQIIKLLNQHSTEKKGVIHAFSGSYQQALDYIKLGFYIGVGGTITYPRAKKTRETISRLPLESLVLETDAPDMPIFGQQGQENHPKNLRNILNELILLRSESEQTIAGQVFRNSQSMYLICE